MSSNFFKTSTYFVSFFLFQAD